MVLKASPQQYASVTNMATQSQKGYSLSTTRFIQTSSNCKTFMTNSDGAGMGSGAESVEKM